MAARLSETASLGVRDVCAQKEKMQLNFSQWEGLWNQQRSGEAAHSPGSR